MNRWNRLDRKALVTTLGTAGLGLGLMVTAAGGVPGALAQEASTPAVAQEEAAPGEGEGQERLPLGEIREELYAEFTAALADELGIGNSDEVDAAIRVAMMTVVDARVDDGLLTSGQAEALKILIATAARPRSDVRSAPRCLHARRSRAWRRGPLLPHLGRRRGSDHQCRRWLTRG